VLGLRFGPWALGHSAGTGGLAQARLRDGPDFSRAVKILNRLRRFSARLEMLSQLRESLYG
jgi:hypothetical protein